MTGRDGMNFINDMYFKYFETENNTGSYAEDVVDILNKVTNSKIYKYGVTKNNLDSWGSLILKDNLTVFDGDSISLANFLKNEIILFKLNLLD